MRRRFPFRTRDGRDGIVRAARPHDARACLAIVGEAVRERPRTLSVVEAELWHPRVWRRHRIEWGPKGASLVAQIGRDVVGQLTIARQTGSRARAHAAEFGVTVARRARGLGVGRALVEGAETWAREHGVTRIQLGVFAGNERARRLYAALGYVAEGVERGGARFSEGDVDVVRMAKLLDAPSPVPEDGATMSARGEG